MLFKDVDAGSLHRLQILQNRAARIILGAKKDTSRNDMFRKLGWLSLNNRREPHQAIPMYKAMNGCVPDYLSSRFITNNQIHTHYTRSSSQIHLIKTRTEIMLRSFTYTGAQLWTSIPHNIKYSPTVASFTSQYQRHLRKQSQF